MNLTPFSSPDPFFFPSVDVTGAIAIEGIVLDKNNKPLSGVSVSIYRMQGDYPTVVRGVSDGNGAFKLFYKSPEDFPIAVVFSRPGYDVVELSHLSAQRSHKLNPQLVAREGPAE